MYEVTSDQELDQIVWAVIKDSSNPRDFIDYLRHTLNRPAHQEEAFQAASRCWSDQNAPRHFDKAVAALEELASGGNEFAMFHLGRWHLLGYGVAIDADKAMGWYRRGSDAGSSRCLINVARYTANEDTEAAIAMFKRAAEELGDLSAHYFWANVDKPNYADHLRIASTSENAYVMCGVAYECLRNLGPEDDAEPWIALLESAAEKGESYACTHLAQIYRNGLHGCAKDTEMSRSWYKKAVALGNDAACAALGRDLLEDDEPAALEYLKRGAMLEDAFAQSVLGFHLTWHGKSHEEQMDGVIWLRASAKQGYRPAMSNLAEALQHGRGPQLEDGEVISWLQKGASLGVPDCQTGLGIAYIKGELIERDEEKAHNLFHLASLQGNAWGTYLLGLTYENGHGTEADAVQAFNCFKVAAEKGSVKGCYKLGIAYLWGEGVGEDIPAAAKWLKKAALAGHADAQAYLGMMFSYGHGVEENAEIALHWLRMSANQNGEIGLRELALLYEAGKGVEVDMAEATRLMAKAAALGDDKARKWIDENYPEKPAWLKGLGALPEKPLPDDEEGQRSADE